MMKTLGQVGQMLADAIRQDDMRLLEEAAQMCGSWTLIRRAAETAGVDLDELEEALGRI